MSAFDTHPESLDEDSQTLHSHRLWKAAGKQDLDFDSQRLRNRLRAKMFGVDASPVTIGRFVVLDTVGSGGMGVVYAAYDEELDRRVAVKLLRSSREEDASVGKGRLQREAQALAKLSHPNVVQVYEVGTFDDRVFLAMEFLSGPNLRAWLVDEPRPWQQVLRHFIEAGEGLAAAHREGIIHRDFKPANVLFGGDGRVRVVDFGLARASGPAREPQELPSGEFKERAFAVELTQTGEIMGTPAYMSPEQARYEGVDARSDQYSFCVALYEALFGRRPHVGLSTAEVLIAVAEGKVDPPPRNTKVPARVVRAIMRGLSCEPSARFPSMEALLAQLSLEDRGRWRLLGAGTLAVAGLGAFMFMGEAECPSFESDLNDAWGPDHRAAIQTAFVDSGASRASHVGQKVSERLDAYAAEWLDARRDACEAHRVRREQSDQLHDQRVACLLEREVEFVTLTRVFAQADAKIVEQAPRAVAELSPLEECRDFERMSAASNAPVSRQLRSSLAEVRAQYKAGLYDQALAGAANVIESARVEGVRWFEAEAWLQQGLIEERRRAFESAATAAENALDLAEVSEADGIAARAWSRLARYQAALEETKLADQSVRRAQAKVERLGDEPELLLEVRESRALVAWEAGRHGEAIDDQMIVVEDHRGHRGEDDPRTAEAERRLANMLSDVGRHEEAQQVYGRARGVFARAYGVDHPMVARVLTDAAIDHRAAGRLDEARRDFREAERMFVASQGPDTPAVLTIYKSLGDIALVKGDFEEAKQHADRLRVLVDKPGVSDIDRPDVLALQAHVAERRGEYEEALEAWRQYLVLTEKDTLGEWFQFERIIVRINLSEGLVRVGRHDQAELELRRAMDELDHVTSEQADSGTVAKVRGNVWFLLGQCMEARGEPALDAYRQGLEGLPKDLPDDDEAHLVRAKLQWALAQSLRATDPGRAEQLARDARPHLDEAAKSQVDTWLAEPPR